jgi:hypothetical protein
MFKSKELGIVVALTLGMLVLLATVILLSKFVYP